MEHTDVLVVGGGQAGLAVSHELTGHGIDHLVLERGRIGQTWRDRWDSFCLVTPNWTVQLPGRPYAGADPDGYMPRDEIVKYLEGYAADSGVPIREGVAVHSIDGAVGGFVAQTSAGTIGAGRVVLATGAFQRAHRPAGTEELPSDLLQIDISDYRSPDALPAGPILIIGSGQTGAQLAEELREAGREVVLSCGKVPWAPRRFGGHDLVWWLALSGFFNQPVAEITTPGARLLSNPLATGHGGGHDLSLRTLRAMGVTLAGHFLGAAGNRARFAPDLAESVAWGDARYRDIMALASRTALDLGFPPPDVPEPPPFDGGGPEEISLTGFGAVLFAGGFRPDFRSWLPWPDAFDTGGFPLQVDGRSSVVDGLYFVGIHFLRTRKSSILYGVGEDASVVAQSIAAEVAAA